MKQIISTSSPTARRWLGGDVYQPSLPRRHRWWSLLVIAALTLSIGAGLLPTRNVYAQNETLVAITNIDGALLRSAPNGATVETIAAGLPVTATGRTADSLWIAVRDAAGNAGWVAADELVIFGVARLPVASGTVNNGTVDSGTVSSGTVDSGTVTAVSAVAPSATGGSETVVANTASNNVGVEMPVTSTTEENMQATVNLPSGRLNVRSAPTTTSPIIGKAYPGDKLAVVGRSSGSDWAQIAWPAEKTSGQIGWVAARYLTVTDSLDSLPVVATVSDAPVYTEVVNQRGATTVTSTATQVGAAAPTSSSGGTGLSGILVIESSPGGMIYAYNLTTGALWSLTNGFDPAISPDGKTVAFAREGGENGIYLINIDGSNERLIFSGRTRLSSPKWSPDGNWILFTRSDEYTECVQAGPGGCVSINSLPPNFPTDNLTVRKDYEYDLAAIDPQGGNYHDIASLESARVADWNAAGIVYQSSAGLQITADKPNTDNNLLLFTPLQPPYEDPDWQPNGGQVLFVQHHGSHYEIFTIGADGSGMTALTRPVTTLVDQMPNNVAPAWSPDGQHIVFLSNREANNEAGAWRVWVMDADGSNQHALPIDVTINYTYGNEQSVDWGS